MLDTAILIARLLAAVQGRQMASFAVTFTVDNMGRQRWIVEIYHGLTKVGFATGRHINRTVKRAAKKAEEFWSRESVSAV